MPKKKNLSFLPIVFLLFSLIFPSAGSVLAKSAGSVTNYDPVISFPETITFRATIENDAPITSVVLEYGTTGLTCGTVIAKAYPRFTPDTKVDVEWTWEMRQSGSLPPGTSIWWQWRYVDQKGVEQRSEKNTVIWMDSEHNWETLSSGDINLHWYMGDRAFAEGLLQAAEEGLDLLYNDAGLTPAEPVNLYIYGDTADMRDAILYEPGWTGGVAYADHSIVIIGIAEEHLEWGLDTIVHELTHVLVGHFTFSCLGDIPTWLNEGLAVYAEGELDSYSQAQFDDALAKDELFTIRSLSGGFSEDSDKAHLSYTQSRQVVEFMVKSYGQEKMNALLLTLSEGTTIDGALMKVYGFDLEGLEREWRSSIGAKVQASAAQPTAQPTPTYVPTYVPYSANSQVITPTPYAIPTSSVTDEPYQSPEEDGTQNLAIVIVGVACCCLLLLVGGGAGTWFFISRRKGKGE